MAKKTNRLHISVHLLQQIGLLSSPEHIKRLSERHISHDIEAQVIEPSCHVDRSTDSRVDRIHELTGIFPNPWLITTES